MKMWKIGLTLTIVFGLIHGALLYFERGGLVREIVRVFVFVGLCVWFLGLIGRFKNKE